MKIFSKSKFWQKKKIKLNYIHGIMMLQNLIFKINLSKQNKIFKGKVIKYYQF